MLAIWDYKKKSFTVQSSSDDWRWYVGKVKHIQLKDTEAVRRYTDVPCTAEAFMAILKRQI